MKVTVRRSYRVGERRTEIRETYGPPDELRAHPEANPHDVAARVALHDLTEYADADPDLRIDAEQTVIIPDEALDRLTLQRLHLLLAIHAQGGAVASVRSLARLVDRDVKNVSQDVHALSSIGLLHTEPGGHGRPTRVHLPGDEIDLHLVEAAG